jgi:phage I-like protein
MNNVLKSGEVFRIPKEFQVLPCGEIELEGEGTAFLDSASMDEIIENFESRGNDMVVDYEHQTLKDT